MNETTTAAKALADFVVAYAKANKADTDTVDNVKSVGSALVEAINQAIYDKTIKADADAAKAIAKAIAKAAYVNAKAIADGIADDIGKVDAAQTAKDAAAASDACDLSE